MTTTNTNITTLDELKADLESKNMPEGAVENMLECFKKAGWVKE